MGLAEELERRLERAVEGFFSKAFRSAVQPAEIGRRLLREQEGGKSVSLGAVYVPNHYLVGLSPIDYERFEGMSANLISEFVELLKDNAKERRWKFSGPVEVIFEADPKTQESRFHVVALHEAAEVLEDAAEPLPVLRLMSEGLSQEWVLNSDVTIGRQSDCEIVVADLSVSRRHAQVVQRVEEWWIVDAGSSNGTFVNESMVKERRLSPGDVIQLGSTRLEFVHPQQ